MQSTAGVVFVMGSVAAEAGFTADRLHPEAMRRCNDQPHAQEVSDCSAPAVRLFRLLGIPVSVDASWLIILALLTLSLASGFPAMLHQFFPRATHNLAPTNTGSWA